MSRTAGITRLEYPLRIGTRDQDLGLINLDVIMEAISIGTFVEREE